MAACRLRMATEWLRPGASPTWVELGGVYGEGCVGILG
jgi:hypothetical protein